MNTPRRTRPLYRDPDDKIIGGVCSGLARYFDIDTILVRVAFVVIALVGGGGVLAYVLLWLLMEPAPAGFWTKPSEPEAPEVAADDDQAEGADEQ